jgi:hypothetical protein
MASIEFGQACACWKESWSTPTILERTIFHMIGSAMRSDLGGMLESSSEGACPLQTLHNPL